MATDPLAESNEQPLIAGVRLPGTGRVRFYRAPSPDTELHTWVAIDGVRGPEPGVIVIAPLQVVLADLPGRLQPILRPLTAEEFERVATLDERARYTLDRAALLVREANLPLFVTGLRFTLAGDAVIVSYRSAPGADATALERIVEEVSGLPVHLEAEGGLEQAPGNLFGGLGRLRAQPIDLEQVVADRFDVLGDEPVFAPETLPRLGSRVTTGRGTGVLRSVRTRDRLAIVRLDTGEEISVPVDTLVPGPA